MNLFSRALIDQVQRFAPFLRQHGFSVGTPETLLALHVLSMIPLDDAELAMGTTRAVYAHNPAEWAAYPGLFRRHFSVARHQLRHPLTLGEDTGASVPGNEHSQTTPSLQVEGAMLPGYHADAGERYPVRLLTRERLSAILYWTRKAVRQMESMNSRRLRSGRRPRVDLRRTLQRALRQGGEPFVIVKRQYRKARPRVVIAIDVSGSMRDYADFYLTLAWAFIHSPARVEAFVFSTDIKRVTPLLERKIIRGIPMEALVELKGGTRIGLSLSRLLHRYGGCLRGSTYLIVVSDGYDTGNLQLLRKTMNILAARVGRLIWMNPLLAEAGYEPVSGGISTALPFIDHFIDVHDGASWRTAVQSRLFYSRPNLPGMRFQC